MKTIRSCFGLFAGLMAVPAFAQLEVRDLAANPSPSDLFNGITLDKSRDMKSACVSEVRINFVTRSSMFVAKGRGLDRAAAETGLTFAGPGDDDLQWIADETAKYLAEKLAAGGVTIVPAEKFAAHAAASAAAEDKPALRAEWKLSGVWDTIAKASGATHVRTFTAGNRPPLASIPGMKAMKLFPTTKDLGASLVSLEVTLEFVQYFAKKGMVSSWGTHGGTGFVNRVSVASTPQIYPSAAKLTLLHPSSSLSQVVHKAHAGFRSTAWIGEVKETAQSGAFAEWMGKGWAFYDVRADPAGYKAEALKTLRAYVDLMVARLGAGK